MWGYVFQGASTLMNYAGAKAKERRKAKQIEAKKQLAFKMLNKRKQDAIEAAAFNDQDINYQADNAKRNNQNQYGTEIVVEGANTGVYGGDISTISERKKSEADAIVQQQADWQHYKNNQGLQNNLQNMDLEMEGDLMGLQNQEDENNVDGSAYLLNLGLEIGNMYTKRGN